MQGRRRGMRVMHRQAWFAGAGAAVGQNGYARSRGRVRCRAAWGASGRRHPNDIYTIQVDAKHVFPNYNEQ